MVDRSVADLARSVAFFTAGTAFRFLNRDGHRLAS
jgi:hypothetical protein